MEHNLDHIRYVTITSSRVEYIFSLVNKKIYMLFQRVFRYKKLINSKLKCLYKNLINKLIFDQQIT